MARPRSNASGVPERELAELLTDENRSLLASVLASLGDLVFLLDRDGRITHFHAPDPSLLYTEPATFLGRSVGDVLPPEVAGPLSDAFAEVMATGRARQVDYQLDLRGEPRWWTATLSVRRHPGGELAGLTVASRDVTQHRAAEELLRQNEARLRAVLDLAPIGIAQADIATGRFLAVNQRMCTLTGYSADELLARTVADITHPDDVAAGGAVVAAGAPWAAGGAHLDKRYVRKDGSIMWGRVRRSLLVDASGRPAQTVGVIEDITERRETEQRLRLQTSALHVAANGIVITDPQGIVQWVNPAFTTLTGYEESEVVGKSVGILKSGRQDPAVYRDLWDTILSGRVWHGELINQRKDGSVYHEDMMITPVKDSAGSITHFVAIKQDISARRRSEDALRASEERYRTLVDQLDDVVFVTDDERRIAFVNRAVERFGYLPEDLIGRHVDELVYPDDAAAVQRLRDEQRGGPVELRVLDGAGRPRPVRASIRARVEGTFEAGVTGVLTDLTHLRTIEEQMRAAQKMEAVGTLAGGIAHDFNNLLTVIISYAELASESVRSDDALRDDLREILRASRRAESLTRQLLAFSRRQMMRPQPLDLNELVDGIASMIGRLIGEHIELRVSCRASHRIQADRGQIEQVVMNLVVNARDAMPNGGRLTISTGDVELDATAGAALELTPGSYVELVVADTGSGMDDDTRGRVFEPFFTTKGAGKGTGLGLSTVYGIVKQSGGGIDVRSAVGKGSVFRVCLPRLAVSHAATHESVRPTQAHGAGGHETVLVVEDEPALREVAQRVLSAAGYRVLVAADASEALSICAQRGAELDLVVTDVVMPGMNGIELAERLGTLCPETKLLFTSGYTEELIGTRAKLGPHFLPKPYDWHRLVRAVRDALDAER